MTEISKELYERFLAVKATHERNLKRAEKEEKIMLWTLVILGFLGAFSEIIVLAIKHARMP